MHLLDAPLTLIHDARLGSDVWTPALPDGVEWAQASDRGAPLGRRLVVVHAEDALLDAVVAVPTMRYLRACCPSDESRRVLRALKEEPAPRVGKAWANRDEMLAMYRPHAIEEEVREAARRSARLKALTTLHQDDFSGGDDADIDGRTMSDALGAWLKCSGSAIAISSGVAVVGGATMYEDSAMSAVDVQRATFKFLVADIGAAVRTQGAGGRNCYLAYSNGNFYMFNGSYNSLGSMTTASANDFLGCDANSTTITPYLNGSGAGTPATDGTWANGKAGVQGNSTGQFDDWKVEVADSAPATNWRLPLLGVG